MSATRRLVGVGALLILAGLVLGAIVTAGHGIALDRAILLALRVPGHPGVGIGPDWFGEAVLEVTGLGAPMPLLLATLLVATVLAARGQGVRALCMIGASLGGRIVVLLLKDMAARPRPTVVPALVEASSTSYPSAHATNSAIVCLCAAMLLVRGTTSGAERRALYGAAMLTTLLIGASRVYVGVHWPSDVAAGWMLGSGWAILWVALARKLAPAP